MKKLNLQFHFTSLQIGICSILILTLVFFLFKIPSISPIDEDEVSYISGATTFAETNSVKARLIIAEDVSKYLEADWYGPFYPVFYGSVMKIFGTNSKVFIFTNLFLLIFVIILVSRNKLLDPGAKNYLIVLLISSPFLIKYFYYFMPVSLNVFFLLMLILYLVKINNIYHTGNPQALTKHICIYAGLVLFFAFFRVTIAFAIIGILPFAGYKKKAVALYLALVLLVIGVTFVFMNQVTAPPYAKNVSTLQYLTKLDFVSFFKGFFKTALDNLLNKFPRKVGQMKEMEDGFLLVYYFLFFSPFYFTFRYLRKKNKLLLGIALICLASNIVSIMFYYLSPRFFLRLSAPVFAALCFILAIDAEINKKVKMAFSIVLLICTLFAFRKILPEIKGRNEWATAKKSDMYLSLKKIAEEIPQQSTTTILIDRGFLKKYPPRAGLLYSLPFTTNQGGLIRYTVNIIEQDSLLLHNKMHVDYILTSDPLNKENFSYFRSNNFFRLYKNNL